MRKSRSIDAKAHRSIAIWAKSGHDLKQPIQSLMLLAHIMAETDDSGQRKRTSQAMEASLQALQRMLDELAMLARFELGLETLKPQRVSLDEVVSRIARQQVASAEQRQVNLKTRLKPVKVTMDLRLLTILLTGLIHNAIKVARCGEVQIALELRGSAPSVEIEFDGQSLTLAQTEATFVELPVEGDGVTTFSPSAGLGLLAAFAMHVGGAMEFDPVTNGRQRITLLLPEMKHSAEPVEYATKAGDRKPKNS